MDLDDVKKLTLDKDDILVIRIPNDMPIKYFSELKIKLGDALPGQKVLILSDLYDIGVLKKRDDTFYSLFDMNQPQ